MDDLRDYRFYESDMIHPNSVAVQYIWKRFLETYIDSESIGIMNEIKKLNKAKSHIAQQPESQNYQDFLNSNLHKIEALKKKHPFLDLHEEEEYFKNQLITK
jgi:prophage maintenance system killer protein